MPASSRTIAGLTGVLAAGVTGYQAGKEGRQAAQIKKKEGEAKLRSLQYQEETNSVQLQIDTLNAKNQELMRTQSTTIMHNALRAYSADGEVRHLNQVQKTDPMWKARTIDVATIAKIDPAQDMQLIKASGRVPDGAFETDPKTAGNRFVKLVMKDGTSEIMDMENVYAGTGYAANLAKEEQLALIRQNKIGGTEGKDVAMTRKAKDVADAKDRIAKAEEEGKEPTTRDKEIVAFGETEKAGVTAGKLSMAEEATTKLVDMFGGQDEFFATTFDRGTTTGNKNYLKAYPMVARIERAEGADLSASQKTQLNDIRTLIAMGDPAKDLTSEETGLFDSTFLRVKKYFSDNIEGIGATSAFAAFRNTVLRALSGATLTEVEVKNFHEAFGTLGNKLGPVLRQFKTAITQVQAQLNSIASMQNPYSAKVRLGVDEERLDGIRAALDKRLEELNNYYAENVVEDEKSTVKLKGSFGGKR